MTFAPAGDESAPTSRAARAIRAPRLAQRRLVWFGVFLAPFLILFVVFLAFPIASTAVLSLQRKDGLAEGTYVGLKNYVAAIADPRMQKATWNTAILVGASLFVLLPCAFALALALNSSRVRFRAFFRVVFFLPAACSAVAASMIWLVVLEDQSGALNGVLGLLGVPKVGWLTTAAFVLPSIFLVSLWRWTGYNALFFLAGLQTIPGDLIDAARVDGASSRQTIQHVVLPLLRPIMLVVVVLAIIGSVQLFAEPRLLTKGTGGPDQNALTLAMLMYDVAFRQLRFGYGAAIAYVAVIGAVSASVAAYGLLRSRA
jgi:ABC-type sugar transport system permease subunit